MENRIITAVFKGSKNTKVSDVWQWDYGQILRIQGLDLPMAVEVDFAVAGASESIARIGTTKDGVTDVVIPDSLIETGKNLVAYIYLRDSVSGNTEYQIDMLVTKRAKPEAYNRPEDKELFGQAIEAVNTAADRAEKAGQAAQEAAQKAGLDAEQTAQDRAEVAKMVETVTDISEQVKKVEELSNKAQESATQAGASAVVAEKAKAQAETAAGKTAEDRTAVNQAKIAVDEVQKAVRADRAAVEEVKQSVEQLGNAIPESTQAGVQAVNQAKQTAVDEIARTATSHKIAVEGAGTQAVENVENVKQAATTAVETVKTEAVQSVQTEGTKQTGNVSAEGAKRIKEVQDKGAEVLQSIPEDFATQMETKLNKQQGIENKGKVLVIGEDGNVVPEEVASGGGDGIAIINTMSGESPLVIPDSAERVNKRLELGGKTEQVQTTGKNLIDYKKIVVGLLNFTDGTFSGIYHTYFTTDFIEIESGDYVISHNSNAGIQSYALYDINNKTYVSGKAGNNKVNVLNKCLIRISFNTKPETDVSSNPIDYAKKCNIQLENGTTATPYEPYTGGKPSPSPEYPQEIKNVGKWNDEKQKYEIEVVLSGKNLLDITACEDGKVLDSYGNIINSANGFLTDFIPCFANSPYCRSKKSFTIISFYDRDKNFIGCINQYNDKFITPDECRYFRFSINKQDVDYTKAVANVGTALMDYEPYKKPQTLTLTSDRPLTKWDRLVEQGGQIGWLYAGKKSILNEKTSWDIFRIDPNEEDNFVFTTNLIGSLGGNQTSFCKTFKNINYAYAKEHRGKYGLYSDHVEQRVLTRYFRQPNESVRTIEQWKEWLINNSIELWYESKTSEFVPLPQSEQNAIRALKTYYPTTVITVDGGELDPDIKATYTADTKNYIDGKIGAINKALLNTQKVLL